MNINNGTASKFWFVIMPKIRLGMAIRNVGSKRPIVAAIAENNKAMPAKMNPTGYPLRSIKNVKKIYIINSI